jgi:hypothetical protein
LPIFAIFQLAFQWVIKKSLPNPQLFALDFVFLWILPFYIGLFNETILLEAPPIPNLTFSSAMFRNVVGGIILVVVFILVLALICHLIFIHRQAGILIEKGISFHLK